jgi:hypothetical protein
MKGHIMKDIANNDVYPGDKIKILFSDYKNQEGMIVRVIYSDNPNKIKVEFNESWVGYFFPHQVVKYNEMEEIKEKLDDHDIILEILKDHDHHSRIKVINAIREKYKCEIFLKRGSPTRVGWQRKAGGAAAKLRRPALF